MPADAINKLREFCPEYGASAPAKKPFFKAPKQPAQIPPLQEDFKPKTSKTSKTSREANLDFDLEEDAPAEEAF